MPIDEYIELNSTILLISNHNAVFGSKVYLNPFWKKKIYVDKTCWTSQLLILGVGKKETFTHQ